MMARGAGAHAGQRFLEGVIVTTVLSLGWFYYLDYTYLTERYRDLSAALKVDDEEEAGKDEETIAARQDRTARVLEFNKVEAQMKALGSQAATGLVITAGVASPHIQMAAIRRQQWSVRDTTAKMKWGLPNEVYWQEVFRSFESQAPEKQQAISLELERLARRGFFTVMARSAVGTAGLLGVLAWSGHLDLRLWGNAADGGGGGGRPGAVYEE